MPPTRQQPNAKTALAVRRENGEVATNTLADQIRAMEQQFQLAMPKGAEAKQLIRDAITALRMTRKLADCEAQSVLGGLMTCAQLGLRPGVLGHAWLLPFWDGKTRSNKAQLVIGYQGLVELAHRSGKIKSLIARTVYENDEFEVDYGLADSLIHKPNLLAPDRGQPVAYYAIAKFTTGGHAFYVMSHAEMERYRDKYAKARTREGKIIGPWLDEFEGMAHKTCVRQLSKWMPKSTEMAVALAADDGVRIDLTPTVDAAEVTEHPVWEGEIVQQPEPDSTEDAPAAGEAVPDWFTREQREAMNTAFGFAGLTDPEEQIRWISALLDRPLANGEALTRDEAAKVLTELERYAVDADDEPDSKETSS